MILYSYDTKLNKYSPQKCDLLWASNPIFFFASAPYTDMSFQPHYSELKRGKNYLYLVHYSKHSTVRLYLVYNEISSTNMGVKMDGFIENIRGLLYAFPDFLEVLGVDPTKELNELGFLKSEPKAMELLLFQQ